jgi:hypothetical protein
MLWGTLNRTSGSDHADACPAQNREILGVRAEQDPRRGRGQGSGGHHRIDRVAVTAQAARGEKPGRGTRDVLSDGLYDDS